ncbi:MAG TPA: ATP-binding protein [Ktedonobacteraceae bacterium]|nr:ATP-binding protein [Ktedonobacteraceae bacterium]
MTSTALPPNLQPVWWLEFRRLFQAGMSHCFIVSGDIHGVTAFHGLSQQVFLTGVLAETREVVACYHPATGITFPHPSMRAVALSILGPEWHPPAAADDPYAAALDELHLRATPQDLFAAAKKPAQALPILDALLHAPQAMHNEQDEQGRTWIRGRVAVIVDQADVIIPLASKAHMPDERLGVLATLLSWGHDPILARQHNPILLLTPFLGDLHADLLESSSGYRLIEQPLPDEQTRLAYLRWYQDVHRQQVPIPLRDLDLEDFARTTAGLDLRQIEDVYLAGASDPDHPDGPLPGVSRALIKERKDAIVRQQFKEVIEMLEPLEGGFASVGGMQQFTTWFREEVIAPLRAGRLREVPRGLLLVGPPGTGKTLLVRAAAWELGFHAIQVHMANILGGIVGTSERNLQKIFRLARDLAPTFLFIDEIDQSLLAHRGASSGSPVAGNLFGAMLHFLGDSSLRGRVIVVGATNHPERLDPALRRSGRFEVTFPILSPDRAARADILAIQARQQETQLSAEALDLLVEETERYSAADLEALVSEARLLARLEEHQIIGIAQARAALDNLRPATLGNVDAYTRSAMEACTNLRYLPPALAEAERVRLATVRRDAASEPSPVSSTRRARML